MASKSVGLTDAKIRGLKAPSEGQVEIKDAVVPGLRLRVGASGVRTFLLRKRVAGVLRNITIGRYSDRFGLVDARKKARIVLSDIEAGGDPYQHVPNDHWSSREYLFGSFQRLASIHDDQRWRMVRGRKQSCYGLVPY